MLASAATSGALRYFVEPLLALVMTPFAVWYVGMGNLLIEMPPPLCFQAVSDFQEPPAPLVTRSVPPTEVTWLLQCR